jgi:hypothetical protein
MVMQSLIFTSLNRRAEYAEVLSEIAAFIDAERLKITFAKSEQEINTIKCKILNAELLACNIRRQLLS